MLPAIFVSHGAPNMVLHDSPTRRFLSDLGHRFPTPRAAVVISAHWETDEPLVGAASQPETIHDFYGFEPEMYRMRYPAPGAPQLAREIVQRLASAGVSCDVDEARGIDHGVWTPLMLMYPQADVPVTQISVQTQQGAAHHFRLGEALRALREEDVLVLGSGGATHNLRELSWHDPDAAASEWALGFAQWLRKNIERGDVGALLAWRDQAPQAARNHPTEEHFLPLFAALGAGSPGAPGRVLHAGFSMGSLAMDAYAFD